MLHKDKIWAQDKPVVRMEAPERVNQQLLDLVLPAAGRAGRQYGQTRRSVEE
jgi:hypothetical protein